MCVHVLSGASCALEIPDVGAGGAVDLGEDAAVWVDPQAKVAVVGAALAEDAGPVADALGWVGPDGDGEVFGELEVAAAWLADCTRGLRPCDGAGVRVHGGARPALACITLIADVGGTLQCRQWYGLGGGSKGKRGRQKADQR